MNNKIKYQSEHNGNYILNMPKYNNNDNDNKSIILDALYNNESVILNKLDKNTYRTVIGEGTFGQITLYKCKKDCNNSFCKNCFIVKKLKYQESFSSKDRRVHFEKFFKEYYIGKCLDHRNIRKTFAANFDLGYIVFENCRGLDLLDYANSYTAPNTRKLTSYFNQIVNAVCYLHGIGIAHLDLKLENIILDTNTDIIKLIDFGEAVYFKNNDVFRGLRGTIQYLPPEAISLKNFSSVKTDIWSCGIILYNLFYNYPPWDIASGNDNKYKQYQLSLLSSKLDSSIFPELNHYYSNNEWYIFKYLFKNMLNPIAEKRISIDMIRSVFLLLNL